ncbi:MAG TPA: redoxin domain-containing protein [Gemmataceae bacterium]|jgi:alkyl hydroperoxide reductase subunit AhpC|nr:redoxin domain-containing protein [Gemmataceae bacterium]
MIELGELERNHEEFAKRNTRVVVVSDEGLDDAQQTQKDFPHLVVIADADKKLISAVEVLHPHGGQNRNDVAAPTTFFIDKQGMVRGTYRTKQVISRLSAKEVLAMVDAELGK